MKWILLIAVIVAVLFIFRVTVLSKMLGQSESRVQRALERAGDRPLAGVVAVGDEAVVGRRGGAAAAPLLERGQQLVHRRRGRQPDRRAVEIAACGREQRACALELDRRRHAASSRSRIAFSMRGGPWSSTLRTVPGQ